MERPEESAQDPGQLDVAGAHRTGPNKVGQPDRQDRRGGARKRACQIALVDPEQNGSAGRRRDESVGNPSLPDIEDRRRQGDRRQQPAGPISRASPAASSCPARSLPLAYARRSNPTAQSASKRRRRRRSGLDIASRAGMAERSERSGSGSDTGWPGPVNWGGAVPLLRPLRNPVPDANGRGRVQPDPGREVGAPQRAGIGLATSGPHSGRD